MADGETAELRRANRQLQAERNFISAVLDTTGALVIVLDREGRIVRFNRACERLTGYSTEQVRGEYLWNLFLPSDEVEGVKAIFDELTAGRRRLSPKERLR